tara:strand:- start:409 stop:690 length:282 start_codon:yes stop_codon:yes gene_type:complete
MAIKKNLLAKKIYESYLEKGYYEEKDKTGKIIKVATPVINPNLQISFSVAELLEIMNSASRTRGFKADFYDRMIRDHIINCDEAEKQLELDLQ